MSQNLEFVPVVLQLVTGRFYIDRRRSSSRESQELSKEEGEISETLQHGEEKNKTGTNVSKSQIQRTFIRKWLFSGELLETFS